MRFSSFWPVAVTYLLVILSANWLAASYIWPVGFGLKAPAGVFSIGLALALRDWLHELRGLRAALVVAYVAGVLSFVLSEVMGWTALRSVALGSVAAFAFSETTDALVYHPLRRRHAYLGLVLSNAVGLLVDSAIFLMIAFGSLAFFWGQVVGKSEMTLVALGLIWALRLWRQPVVA